MKLNFHVHLHIDEEVLDVVRELLEKGIKVMESPEVAAFRARVETALTSFSGSLSNVAADVQRLLERNPGLSEEDKTSLEGIATGIESAAQQVADLSALVPED